MTGNGSQYVAEQAWTCVSPGIASRLLDAESPTWLLPFLRLAGGEGEQAGARVLATPDRAAASEAGAARTRLEEVELGDRLARAHDGTFTRPLLWQTAGFAALFRRLEADLSAKPRASGTVLGLEGRFERPASLDAVPNGVLAGRRAAETAARSLLGHLRAALEHPASEQMLA